MPETLPPRIIQTTFPTSNPNLCLVATWIKRKVQESDLRLLEPNISWNLVEDLSGWKNDIVAQPTRLLAALITGDFDLLTSDWNIVTGALRRQDFPIEDLNSFAFQAAIVIEESLDWKSFAHIAVTAVGAFMIAATGVGHEVVPQVPALGDAALAVCVEGGFLIVTNGPSYIASRWPRLLPFSRGINPAAPVQQAQPIAGNVAQRIFRPRPETGP